VACLRAREDRRCGVREKAWQQQVIELALLYGWFIYHTYDSRRSQPGWPDLVLARPTTGELIFVELKTDVGRLSPAQRSWLRVLEDCNQEVHVWRPRDFEAVHARLKRQPVPLLGFLSLVGSSSEPSSLNSRHTTSRP
jgi:hypothetical protein